MEKSFVGRLSGSHSKTVSWAMFLLMYAELALPFAVRAGGVPAGLNRLQPIRESRLLMPHRVAASDPSVNKVGQTPPSALGDNGGPESRPETGGPGQPEMATFQSVNANNNVDLFSGDFSYNIPLMDVGGYPINIHYSSGVSMDQEASWVGLGWNLNPGTINRNMRGLPDDFNGRDSITKIQNMRVNKTVGARVGGGIELFGSRLGLSGNIGLFNNSYLGFGVDYGFGAMLQLSKNGMGSKNSSYKVIPKAGLNFSNNSQTGFGISPSLLVGLEKTDGQTKGSTMSFGLSTGYHSRSGLSQLTISADYRPSKRSIIADAGLVFGGRGVSMSFATPSFTPSISMPVTSSSMNFQGKLGGSAAGVFYHVFIDGYVQQQEIRLEDRIQKMPAYGYIYFTEGNNNRNALLDFNREKELQYNFETTPHIAIPQYTYDVYSISGEGIGGTIRPYRGEIGHTRDHQMTTRSTSDDLGIEGPAAHYGLNFERTSSVTTYGSWNELNDIRTKLQFQQSDSNFQSVYFRNPSEKTANATSYYAKLGGDSLIRIKLNASNIQKVRASSIFEVSANGRIQRSIPVENTIVKESRDKRSQVVTYLTATEAVSFGLDKKIYAYRENEQPVLGCVKPQDTISRMDGLIRRGHHLSQVSVLNPDGRRYVYGIPAYNVEQHDVTFSVDKESRMANLDSGMTEYAPGIDNSTRNDKGKEAYFNQEKIPAYAHSFLLTGILSPDYTDLTDDGITEDDLGDGIKFNYSLVYGPGQGYYAWRTPGGRNKANYNEGLKTYSRDDKATYLYGKKEVWYLHSVESKNMIALFKVSADRKDAFAVLDSNGGLNTSKGLRKLDRIDLYTKSDLRKFGNKAKPIKTVHFEYSYDLCKGVNGNAQEGKLTLKRVWFSYNGNNKGKLNPYVFTYSSFNPGYHPRKYDRWGNYKDNSQNPGGLSNADFPYVIQDSAAAARNASAWHLTQVKMPSGGQMKVTYEQDDYAFVQNRRSMSMMRILGLGLSPVDEPKDFLYSNEGHDYVFIEPEFPVDSREAFHRLYLEGNEYLYMKIAVEMPTDQWGSGTEMVPLYGKIAGYGKVSGVNRFWIKLEKTDGISAPLRAALQFLKNNLPSKAMPGSEVGSNVPLGKAVSVLASSAKQILNVFGGFEKQAIKKEWCNFLDLSKSMVRLNNPHYAKLGGGHRVKRVEVFDNWNKMTGQRESVYGQEYQYRTSIEVNGKQLDISSGVATYEPMIGNEENPFRQPIPYAERLAPMAPVAYLYSEMPLGESYFPGASVGYSKVRVRTIHARTKSANGWQESEFFTAKDFPTLVEYTMLDGNSKKRYNPKINFFRIYSVDRVSVSQGFKVVLNDMHGKPKGNASYAETDSIHPIAYSRNFYKEKRDAGGRRTLDNTVLAVEGQDGVLNDQTAIGKDIEVITDFREQKTVTVSAGIQPNVDLVIFIGVYPIPMLLKIPTYDESIFRSAATVKVVQEYGILDSMVVYDKGSLVSTKNLVYDAETGDVLLSRTKNAFKDPVYNYSYPAHWAYSGMGPAYKNVDVILKNLQIHEGRLKDANGLDFPTGKYFESGDEIIVSGLQPLLKVTLENDCPRFVTIPLVSRTRTERIWAIDIAKTRGGTDEGLSDGLFFIDRNGKPYTAAKVNLRILRSGKRNMAGASIGSVVSMKNPIRTVDGSQKIVWNDSSMVVNASAATFRDLWMVDNSLYAYDSCYTKIDTIIRDRMVPQASMLMRQYQVRGANVPISPTANLLNDPHFTAGVNMFSACATNPLFKCRRFYAVKSIIRYDFSGIPSNANVLSATLSLNSFQSSGIWNNNDPDNLNWNALNRAHYVQGSNLGSRNNNANLKVVVSPWNLSTPYNNISTGTASVQVPGAANLQCDNRTLNVLSIAREAIANPSTYNGFILQLNQSSYVDVASELRTLSFGSGQGSFLTPDPVKFTDTCQTTLPPYLTIRYTVTKDTCIRVCRRNINDTMVNPYIWGILGNWRVDRAYTYFSERQSSVSAGTQTNIRRDGLIKDFSAFWTPGLTALKASSDSSRWVWNSSQSIFSRKGFELENYDALYRYNAGRYGYEESLPVAVAQNSKSREIFYAGFEDASYATQDCKTCPTPQDLSFVAQGSALRYDSSQSHSGLYSLRIASGGQATARIPVVSIARDTASIYLKANLNKTPVYGGGFTVEGRGNGLSAAFTGFSSAGGCPSEIVVERGGLSASNIDYQLYGEAPFPGVCPQNLDVSWGGYLQPVYTDNYTFYLTASGYFSIYIQVNGTYYGFSGIGDGTEQEYTIPLELQAGTLYPVQIAMFNTDPGFFITWSWSGSLYQAKEVVPQKQLYTNPAFANGSLVPKVSRYCVSLKNIQPFNVIRPGVSPIRGRTMVLSAWVRLDGEDCLTALIPDNNVVVSFNNGGQSPTPLLKTGPRIEGWQRMEARVTIPANASTLNIQLSGAGGRSLLFDDIRMQPYNSAMKTYVYDPVSLRLMAELDENNYSTFYEYDDDGTLIRVKKETERGIMTIRETRSALIKEGN